MRILFYFMLALALVAPITVLAEEVEINGTISCAKCTLKIDGVNACQNVVVVEETEDNTALYYLADNQVNTTFGEVCQGEPAVTVTGTVSVEDGTTWLTATEILRTPVSESTEETSDSDK